MRIGCAGETGYYLEPRGADSARGRAGLGPGLVMGNVVVENKLGMTRICEVNDAQ